MRTAPIQPNRLAALVARVSRPFGALASQATISLGFFATNLILIRSVAPEEFGTVAVMLGALFFAYNLFGACVTYPMTLRINEDATEAPAVVGSFLVTGLAFAIPIGAAVFALGLIVADPSLAGWAALASIAWLTQSVARKALHARLLFLRAAIGDAVCHLGVPVGVLFSLYAALPLRAAPFVSLTVTAMVALLLQASQCGVRFRHLRGSRACLAECWRIGWVTSVGALTEVTLAQLVLWTLLATHGKAMVAVYTAMQSIMGMSHPLLFSIQTLLVPVVSRAAHQSGSRRALVEGSMAAAPLIAAMAIISLVVLLFPHQIVALLYGAGGHYDAYAGVLRLLALSYLLIVAAECANATLLGLKRPLEQRAAQLIGFASAASLCLPLAAAFGVFGSASVGAISAVGRLASAIPALRR